jgi:hypothetical protein
LQKLLWQGNPSLPDLPHHPLAERAASSNIFIAMK